MKSETLNLKKTKYDRLMVFAFLSLKYYLLSDMFRAELPWFGLDRIFDSAQSAAVFFLSLLHVILCTEILLKISSFFSESKLVLFLLATDPFYLTSFTAVDALLLAVLFEFAVVIFSEEYPIRNNIMTALVCFAAPLVIYNMSLGFVFFVLLAMYYLTEKRMSHEKAKQILLTGSIAALIGYILTFIVKKVPALTNRFSSLIFKTITLDSGEKIYKIIFVSALILFEAFFWINQIITCVSIKKAAKRPAKKKTKYKTNNAENKNFCMYFILGLPACIIPAVGLMFFGVYGVPTITLSIIVCMYIFNCEASNKINGLMSSNSLPLAATAVMMNSIITKELFDISELIRVISKFAPM